MVFGKVGGCGGVQLEPGLEKWIWQVVGSHQVGRVSQFRGGMSDAVVVVCVGGDGVGLFTHPAPVPVKGWSLK